MTCRSTQPNYANLIPWGIAGAVIGVFTVLLMVWLARLVEEQSTDLKKTKETAKLQQRILEEIYQTQTYTPESGDRRARIGTVEDAIRANMEAANSWIRYSDLKKEVISFVKEKDAVYLIELMVFFRSRQDIRRFRAIVDKNSITILSLD